MSRPLAQIPFALTDRPQTASLVRGVLLLALWVTLPGCSLLPNSLQGGLSGGPSPASTHQLAFDGPLSVKINTGTAIPGTNVLYLGKTLDGRANVTIAGQAAPKKGGDSLNWSGAPVPFTLVTLDSRVVSFDDSGLSLLGTVHIIVQNPTPQLGAPGPNLVMEFTLPASYNLGRGETLPGTTLQYIAKTAQGAQFGGVEGFPFRQQLDSVVWAGHLKERVFLRCDLRVVTFSDTTANLAGTLTLRLEQ